MPWIPPDVCRYLEPGSRAGARRYAVNWDLIPRPIEIRVHGLRAVRDKMAQSASAQIGTPLSMNLVKEVDELYTQYESSQRYRSVGSKMSKMQAVAHSRQRATHSNAEAYAGGAKRKMAMKAAWGLKQKGEDHVFVDGSGSDSN